MRYELIAERMEYCTMIHMGDRMTVTFTNPNGGEESVMHGTPQDFLEYGLVRIVNESGAFMDIRKIQAECGLWAEHNFDMPDLSPEDQRALIALTGVAEEAGEVVRAIRKLCQGIRGTREEWIEEIRKESGDVVIQLMSALNAVGLDLADCVQSRWESVSKRDWKMFPKNGLTE